MPKASAILKKNYALDVAPGDSKIKCPKCGHKTLSVKANDEVAKCWHPSCNLLVTSWKQSSPANVIHVLLSHIYDDSKKTLRRQENRTGKNAFHYLTVERKVNPEVVKNSAIGVVPRNYVIEEYVTEANELLGNAKDPNSDKVLSKELQIDEFGPALETLLSKTAGWIIFFYEDQYGRLSSLKFRKPYTKIIRTKKPLPYSGIFISRNGSTESKRLLVTEGEFNSLTFTSLLTGSMKVPDELRYTVCSIGGVNTADWSTVVGINRHPTVCYDNDASGAGRRLVCDGEKYCSFEAFTTPAKDTDLDEFIRSFSEKRDTAIAAVETLIQDRTKHEQSFDSVARTIDEIRKEEDLKGFERNRVVAETIVQDLHNRGSFYTDDRQGYWFREATHDLIQLDKDEAGFRLLMAKYGLNGTELLFKYVFDSLNIHAMESGTQTEISRFCRFNTQTLTLYLNRYDNRMYKVTEKAVKLVDNGTDGVLFVGDTSGEPFDLVEAPEDWSPFDQYVLSLFNFQGGSLSAGESKALLMFWFLGMFFEEQLHTKPILVLLGPKGSGKTSGLRSIGQLLVGPRFDVTPMSSDEKDFDAAITNEFFVVLDNVDHAPKWLDDKLATSATGGTVKRRELYTTNRLVEYRVKSFIGVSTRTPKFRRDDVADRLLVLRLARIDGFTSENVLRERLQDNRNLILSEVVHHLRRVLGALKEEKDRKDVGSFRMADFGNFALRIAGAIGLEPQIKRILKLVSREQSLFTLEDDSLVDLIIDLAARRPGQEFDAAHLCKRLELIARDRRIEFKYKENPRGLAQRLNHIKDDLAEFVDINTREASSRVRMYSFTPRREGHCK